MLARGRLVRVCSGSVVMIRVIMALVRVHVKHRCRSGDRQDGHCDDRCAHPKHSVESMGRARSASNQALGLTMPRHDGAASDARAERTRATQQGEGRRGDKPADDHGRKIRRRRHARGRAELLATRGAVYARVDCCYTEVRGRSETERRRSRLALRPRRAPGERDGLRGPLHAFSELWLGP